MSNEHDKQTLHDLYQSMPKDVPPAELDARILQAAHQAVIHTAPAVVKLRRKRTKNTWYRPVSYAAVMVLALGVILRVQMETSHPPAAPQVVGNSMPESSSVQESYSVKLLASPERAKSVAAPAPEPAASAVTLLPKSVPVIEAKKKLARATTSQPIKESLRSVARFEADAVRDEATVMPEAVSAAPAAAVGATEKIKPDSVESEVTELMRLHKSGDSKQLRMKLREFVVNHPDYILPKDLQPVLQSESNK